MPSILESLTSVLGQGDGMAKLGAMVGGDADDGRDAVDAAGPVLVGGLAATAAGEDGAATVGALLDDADPDVVDDVEAFLDDGGDTAGDGILDSIFDDRDAVVDGLADDSGLEAGSIRDVLPALATLLVGLVAERRADDDLDGDGVAALLVNEREELEADGRLGGWFGGLAKGGGALGALAGAAALAKDKLGDLADDAIDVAADAKEKVSDLAEDAKEKVSGVAEDAEEKVSGVAEDAEEKVSEVAEDAEGAVSAGGAAAAAGGAAATTAGGDAASGTTTAVADALRVDDDRAAGGGDDDRRGGLGWLWWAVGAVLVVLFLAWLLNQCSNGDDTSTTGGAATEEPADDGDAAGDSGDEAGDDAAADDAGDDTTADDAGDDTASDDTASDDGADDLQALVDAAVPAGVTGVVDGDSVTLTGSVDSDEALAAAEDAVAGIEGVGSVDNQIEVSGADDGAASDDGAADDSAADDSAADDNAADDGAADDSAADDGAAPAAGETLNEELGLEPITFRYLSARITPESEAVLAEVIAYLEANDVAIEIQGHTDSDGTEAKNIELSTARAESVKAYLEANGIAADRMTTVGLGEGSPKVPNDSADNKAINRRIEFVVQG